jgi:ArsR family transcriptional regulator, lead/cadmium/zinc/bismuth-responsive transcriptional repressor
MKSTTARSVPHSTAARCAAPHDARTLDRLRKSLVGSHIVGDLAETFKALGDVTRVRILDALSNAELCVCDIASLLDLTESAVSHQLRLLRGLRLVRSRRAGRMVFYALDDDHILSLFEQGMEHVLEASRAGAAASRRTDRKAGPNR